MTWYLSAVFIPAVAVASATNVTTPVEVFNVYVPTPTTVTTPSVSQASGVEPGVIKQVNDVSRPTPEVASAPVPVKVVKATVPPGMTDFDSAVATGAAGAVTVGVIFAPVT